MTVLNYTRSTDVVHTVRFYRNGAWRSLVAHLLWEQGVAGSNPVAPTKAGPWIRGPATYRHLTNVVSI